MKKERKKYLIDQKFQISFILKFILLALVNISSFYLISYFFFNDLFAKGKELGLDSGHPYFNFLNDQQSIMIYYFIIVAIVNFGLITCYGIFFSHKIAGPLERISNTLENINNVNDFNEIQFRKNDYIGRFEVSFNQLVKRIKE